MKQVFTLVIGVAALAAISFSACNWNGPAPGSSSSLATTASTERPETADAELTQRIKTLCESVGDDVGVAVVHVETGRTVEIEGAKKLPLYSVFKLPLAVAVFKEVEEKRLQLDKKVRVTPEDVAPGSQFNTDLWREPVEKTVAELMELSIVRSDNTSSDKLLQFVDGPAGLTRQTRSLGFANIDIVSTSREFSANRNKPNIGAASDVAQLLVRLQLGKLIQPPHQEMLLGFMARSMTGGERRLRAYLPPGTPVADKTGSGASNTNDVGIITLPEGKGHLAIAVLISSSKPNTEAQEKLIAQVARAAYDSYVSSPVPE